MQAQLAAGLRRAMTLETVLLENRPDIAEEVDLLWRSGRRGGRLRAKREGTAEREHGSGHQPEATGTGSHGARRTAQACYRELDRLESSARAILSSVIDVKPAILEGSGVRLEPLGPEHADGLRAATADGQLWDLWFTSVPSPDRVGEYLEEARAGREAGTMLPWAVRELSTGAIVGSTRYHDIVPEIDRVEIGYTWYAQRWQRTYVNTACKLLLFAHAFETLGCKVVGLRTDNFNFASQRAIAALGAKRDGVLRHHQRRRDGTVRDTVMFSVLANEWPDVRRHLQSRLDRHSA
jgi:RimJ/RimL family protein N-acetyltransferase